MAQVSYGTITITDTNDIERVYPIYCKGDLNNPPSITNSTNWNNWKEQISQAGGTGDYIWQRIVTKKTGIAVTYQNASQYCSDAVRVTGEEGSSVTVNSIQYALTQNIDDTPTYQDSLPDPIIEGFWLWVKTIYSDGKFTEIKIKQGEKGTNGSDATNVIAEEFKYQIGTEEVPIFGEYVEKTINNIVEGYLDSKNQSGQLISIWRNSNGVEVTPNSNNIYYDSAIKQYYLYQNNTFIDTFYDEGFLSIESNSFYSVVITDEEININVSKYDKYYNAIFYAKYNSNGEIISSPKYYIVNDAEWLSEYPNEYNINKPIYWVKRTRIQSDGNIITDIYQDKNSTIIFQQIEDNSNTIIDLKNNKNKFIQNGLGTYIVQALEYYDSFDENTYGYNVHTYSDGIQLRYNTFNYSQLNNDGLQFYFQLNNNQGIPNAQGPLAMSLQNNGISFYHLYQKIINGNTTYESKKGFELKKDALNIYTPPNQQGNTFLKMSLDKDFLIFYDGINNTTDNIIAKFGKNAYLKGEIEANNGKIGGIYITPDSLHTEGYNSLNSEINGFYLSNQGDMSGGPQTSVTFDDKIYNKGWSLNKDGTGHFGDAKIVIENGDYVFKLRKLITEELIQANNIVIEGQTLNTKISSLVTQDMFDSTLQDITSQLGSYTSRVQVKEEITDGQLHHYILITAGEVGESGAEEIKTGLKLHDQYIAFQISDGEGGTVQAARMTNDTLEIDKINLAYTLDFGRYILEERKGGNEGTHFSILVE